MCHLLVVQPIQSLGGRANNNFFPLIRKSSVLIRQQRQLRRICSVKRQKFNGKEDDRNICGFGTKKMDNVLASKIYIKFSRSTTMQTCTIET